MISKTAFVLAGHAVVNGKGTGAFGIEGFDEAVEALKLRDDVSKLLLTMGVKVVNENSSFALGQVIAWLKTVVKKGDLVIEFHFNIAPLAVTGIETLVDDAATTEELNLANKISVAIQRVTKDKLRGNAGVKKESESQHARLAILSDISQATNILVEVGFISNTEFIKSYRDGYSRIVEEIAKEIRNYCLV
jgi:N-acetylmuramoyl-L-alanine amidase